MTVGYIALSVFPVGLILGFFGFVVVSFILVFVQLLLFGCLFFTP